MEIMYPNFLSPSLGGFQDCCDLATLPSHSSLNSNCDSILNTDLVLSMESFFCLFSIIVAVSYSKMAPASQPPEHAKCVQTVCILNGVCLNLCKE